MMPKNTSVWCCSKNSYIWNCITTLSESNMQQWCKDTPCSQGIHVVICFQTLPSQLEHITWNQFSAPSTWGPKTELYHKKNKIFFGFPSEGWLQKCENYSFYHYKTLPKTEIYSKNKYLLELKDIFALEEQDYIQSLHPGVISSNLPHKYCESTVRLTEACMVIPSIFLFRSKTYWVSNLTDVLGITVSNIYDCKTKCMNWQNNCSRMQPIMKTQLQRN